MGAVLVIGDKDTHGGAVVSGSSRTFVARIGVAHVGSSVSPDRVPHSGKTIVGPAARGKTKVGGNLLAGHGAPVSCGATVSASHSRTVLV